MQTYDNYCLKTPFATKFRTIFILGLLLLASASAWSQPKIVLIDDNKISLKQAFNKIEQQTGYFFLLDQGIIDLSKRVELPGKRMAINDLLDLILKDTGCSYLLRTKSVIIVKSQQQPALNADSLEIKPQPTQTISGSVIDDQTGHPIRGAKVSISGMVGRESETDHAGRFTIQKVQVGSQRIRTYREGYYLSERGVLVSTKNLSEIEIRIKSTSQQLGSIRSQADKGRIVTAEISDHLSDSLFTAAQRDAIATTEIPVLKTYQSPIASRYLNGISRRDTKFGIKTNLLYLATMSPNLAFEWAMGRKYTAEVSAGFNFFKYGDMFKKGNNTVFNHWVVQPELRYWLCRPFDGHFFGIHGMAGEFSVSELPLNWIKRFPKDVRYEGWAYGGGITYGYQWAIGKRWNLEAALGVGYLFLKYDTYKLEEECKTCTGSNKRHYLGPTKAAVSLIYVL